MATTRVKAIKARVKNVATHQVWPVLEDLIRIADAADIPVCGGVFGALTYFIDSFGEVKDNKGAYAQLEATLGRSVKDLKDFVSVLPTTYLSRSNEQHAIVARDAIKTDLECIRNLLREQAKQNKRNRLSQLRYRKKIKEDIEACRAQLEQSHQAFRDAVSKFIAGTVTQALIEGTPCDEWKITGAKSLPSHAIGLMEPVPRFLTESWRDDADIEFVRTEVDGTDRIAKLFHGERREKVFLDMLRFLQKHKHTIRIWKCVIEIKEAVEFIFACNRHVIANIPPWEGKEYMKEILGGAMVNASDSIMIDVPDTPAIRVYDYAEWPRPHCMHVNPLNDLGLYLIGRVRLVPVCFQLYSAFMQDPGLVLTRRAFQSAPPDPYQAIKALRLVVPLQPEVLVLSLEAFKCPSTLEPGDVVLTDHETAAVTNQFGCKVIGVIDEVDGFTDVELTTNGVAQIPGMTQISDGIYRFHVAPGNSEMAWKRTQIQISNWLVRTDDQTSLFARKAKKFADEYGVMIEDIYFVMTTLDCITFDGTTQPFISRLRQTMYFYLHLDEYPMRYYWTFSDLPLSPEDVAAKKDEVEAAGVPQTRLTLTAMVGFIQFDEWVVEEYGGGDYDDEAVSDDMVTAPGGWDSAW